MDELGVAASYYQLSSCPCPPAVPQEDRPRPPPQGDALAKFVLGQLGVSSASEASSSDVAQPVSIAAHAAPDEQAARVEVVGDAVLGTAAPDWLLKPILGGAWDLPPECLLKTMEGGARRVRYTSFKRRPLRCAV
jgi:hypothetical protein